MSTDKKDYPVLWWGRANQEWIANLPINYCDLPYNCHTTNDQSQYNNSPLVLVSDSQIRYGLPPKEDADAGKKAFVYYSVEAPKSFNRDPKLMGQFSYMMHYHPSADFVLPYFNHHLIDTVLQPPVSTLERKNELRKVGLHGDGRGLAPIAWIVSNCDSASGRRFFVHQLQKYIDVDIYGHCDATRTWPVDADGKELDDATLVGSYKFYLSLENSNCDFYVTEKLERAYRAGVIPIVDGPKDYAPFAATSNALLMVDDYSPKSLAEKVKQLDENDQLYLSHLRYKIPKDPKVPPTIHDLAPAFVRTWSPRLPEVDNKTNHYPNHTVTTPSTWENSLCSLCELVHDVSEGLVQLDPTTRLRADNHCVVGKHLHPTWTIEYQVTKHFGLILAIFLSILFLLSLLWWKPVRKVWLPYLERLVPKHWRRETTSYIPLTEEQ